MLTYSTGATFPLHIAIVDDDPGTAQDTFEMVRDLGCTGKIITSSSEGFSTVENLIAVLPTYSLGVLCDHRLQNNGFARFFGSELVAKLSEQRIPSVLITQFTETDADTSIRLYRKKIPALLKRADLTLENLSISIIQSQSELAGNITPTRKPYRTLLRITNLTNADSRDVVDVFVPGWNPHSAVRFPTDLITDISIREKIKNHFQSDSHSSGPIRLFAQINIGAENAEDLFFDQFEWTEQ